MNFKTIYVCLTNVEEASRTLQYACLIARKCDAHLVGIHPIQTVVINPTVSAYMTVEATEAVAHAQQQTVQKIKEAFDHAVSGEIFPSEWRATTTNQASTNAHLADMCRCADLVIVSQSDSDSFADNQDATIRELIVSSGRPVLVIPRFGEFKDIGQHIMIGWSATLESARAVHNAMPFISSSAEAQIFWVSDGDNQLSVLEESGHELAKTLNRHGANAEVKHYQKGSLSIGDELLNAAADSGSDLIVTGAFGHSRIYDFVVGAATTHLLKHMTVPVMFSH